MLHVLCHRPYRVSRSHCKRIVAPAGECGGRADVDWLALPLGDGTSLVAAAIGEALQMNVSRCSCASCNVPVSSSCNSPCLGSAARLPFRRSARAVRWLAVARGSSGMTPGIALAVLTFRLNQV